MIKVNVFQVGYSTREDYLEYNLQNAVCINVGYVELEELTNNWQGEVWHLLNWGCWNINDDGDAIKPDNVHSPLAYCNSDVILNVDNSDDYCAAQHLGFSENYHTLNDAINSILNNAPSLWPFSEDVLNYKQ